MKRFVYLPVVKVVDVFTGPFVVLDHNGWPVRISGCRIDLVDSKLCAVVELVESVGDKHRVRCGCEEMIVREQKEWKYNPSEPFKMAA